MLQVLQVGIAMLGAGYLLCAFTSRESSRRLDGQPWYINVELLALLLLVAGSVSAVAGAVGVLVKLMWQLGG